MQLDIAVSSPNQGLFDAFASPSFKRLFLTEVVYRVFGVEEPDRHPAEYVVLQPKPATHEPGTPQCVTVHLSGVTRNGRPLKTHHNAIAALQGAVYSTARHASEIQYPTQLAVIYSLIDGDIEYPAGSGVYTSTVEVEPFWFDSHGPIDGDRIVITAEELDKKCALPGG